MHKTESDGAMIGETLGVRYEIQNELIQGPIFNMYSARDKLNGRQIGIRQINEPFNSEATFIQSLVKLAPKLQVINPSIELLHEVLEENGKHYILSELPKGALLSERVKRFAPFTVPVAITTALGIAEALAALHDQGIAHGDVGTHNVIATHEGSVKLQLSGVWQCYSESRTAGAAVLPLMAPYLAPEVCTGQTPSALSDLYSLGIILFELLIGRKPFDGDNPTTVTLRHINSPVPSLRGINAAIPVAVDQLVQRLLAKKPENRISSAAELVSELRQINDQLRFGRTPAVKAPAASTTAQVKSPIAEKKSRPEVKELPKTEEKPKEGRSRDPKDRDVPTWLLAIMALAVLSAVIVTISWVTFLAKKPREIKAPNLVGTNINVAREQVKALGLKIRMVGKEASDKIELDKILRTRPDAGIPIRIGGAIDVIVSSGSRTVKVPNLINMTADEAKIAIEALNLSLDGKPSRITSYDNPPGAIIKQSPEPDEIVNRFTKIRIWIAAPEGADPGSLPGESEENTLVARTFNFKHEVKDVNWEVTVVVEMTDDSGTKVIKQGQFRKGDILDLTEIGYGEKATFRVTYDGEEKEQTVVQAKKITP